MADKVSKEVRKKTMQAVKSKNTKLEEIINNELLKKNYEFQKNSARIVWQT
ncbi:MAG: very short patch repair endonuclease [Sphingobacterium sp.]|nr:very short patch repair endonuclease [Sphingobacterium sp.]